MKKEILKQIEICQISIDWWREESHALVKEAQKLERDHAFGAITDEEMVNKAKKMDQKIDHLERKGLLEQKIMYGILSGAANDE